MNLSNIIAGLIIDNYPSMCKLLEVDTKNGSPKDRQLKNWQRYFNYKKIGHKFEILEVYLIEKPKVDSRVNGNRATYVRNTPYILLDYLYQDIQITKDDIPVVNYLKNKEIMKITALCNSDFLKHNIFDIINENEQITTNDSNNFSYRTSKKLREIVKSTLNQLEKITKDISVINVHQINNNGLRIATTEEENQIKLIEQSTLFKMGVNNIQQVYDKHIEKKYYKIFNDEINKLYSWQSVYRTNQITIGGNFAQGKQKYALSPDDRSYQRHIVNLLILTYLNNNAENEYFKNINNAKKTDKLPDDYIDKQKLLSDKLIKI